MTRILETINAFKNPHNKYDILTEQHFKQWVRIHLPTDTLYWISPKNSFACPIFLDEWRVVKDSEKIKQHWLSTRGLKNDIIPRLMKSKIKSERYAAKIYRALFLDGLGKGTLKKLNKDFDNQFTEWEQKEYYNFFQKFMEKECPLKHFLRHLTLIGERFAEGVVMGPFRSLKEAAEALNLQEKELSNTPSLAKWENEFFRICRQYNRIPDIRHPELSYNDRVADFDAPISVTQIRDLAALACCWSTLTTLDGRDAFNSIQSAIEYWQHQVDPVYNPIDDEYWYFIQCSVGFGRKDLAAAYHHYSLLAMSFIANKELTRNFPGIHTYLDCPKLLGPREHVLVGNPRVWSKKDSLEEKTMYDERDYTPPVGRPLQERVFWEVITQVSCFIHTRQSNIQDFKRSIWQPLSLAKTSMNEMWNQRVRQNFTLFFIDHLGVRVYQDRHSPDDFYATDICNNKTFWFKLNQVKSHQYEAASNANAIEASVRSSRPNPIPYVVSYDDWAIPGSLEPDAKKYSRQYRVLRLCKVIHRSILNALATAKVIRIKGVVMGLKKFEFTWFSPELINFLKSINYPYDLSDKDTKIHIRLTRIGDLIMWIYEQPMEIFQRIDFPIAGKPTTLLGKKLDFVNKIITLDTKHKDEHIQRFKEVLETGMVTIEQFLKITGILVHWAEGSKLRRNLVAPLFKTIVKSIAPIML